MRGPFSLPTRMWSFRRAAAGLQVLFATQHNSWIHALVTLVVLGLGFALEISRNEWCWLALAIASVWCAETFNTALETLADAVAPDPDPLVGRAKDVAAAAVLVAALGAAVIGLLVLGPHLLARL